VAFFAFDTPTVENDPTVGIKEMTPTVEIKTPTVEIKIVWQNFAATPYSGN